MVRRAALCLSVAVIAAFGVAPPCVAAPSDLDRTFGKHGIANLSSFGSVTSLIALHDGRYLGTAGGVRRDHPPDGSLFALRPHGAMDSRFGSGGIADFAGRAAGRRTLAAGVLRQPGGKFVVWGRNPSGPPALRLVRYARDGSVDRSFGSDGRVEIEHGQVGRVIARPDGSLVGTVQTCEARPPYPYSCTVMLFALTPDGAVDRTFGADGAFGIGAEAPPDEHLIASVLAADRQGRIVVATGTDPATFSGYVTLARYNANGSRDRGFGRDTGVLLIGPDRFENPADMLVQRNGKIVLLTNHEHATSGTRLTPNGRLVTDVENTATVTRLTRNGALDRSFGSRGRTSVGKVRLTALALQHNGKLVAAGTDRRRAAFALFRFTSVGRLDRTFGDRGRVFTRTERGSHTARRVGDVVVDPDGKIVVAGGAGSHEMHPVLIRYKGGRSTR